MLRRLSSVMLLAALFVFFEAFAKENSDLALTPLHLSREVRILLATLIALVRLGISTGVLDGFDGTQTSKAVSVFQKKYGLEVTGKMDLSTRQILHIYEPVFTQHTV